jgi:hypothetical protein
MCSASRASAAEGFVSALWQRDFSTVARYAKIKIADGDTAKVEELVKKRMQPLRPSRMRGVAQ